MFPALDSIHSDLAAITKRKRAGLSCCFVFFFRACTLNAHAVDALSCTQSCFICVLRRKNKMLTKQTHIVKPNSLTIQTSAELLLIVLLYCVSLGDHNPRIFPIPASSATAF